MWEQIAQITVVVLLLPVIIAALALTIQFVNNASRNMASSNAGTSMGITDAIKSRLVKD